MIWLVQWFDLLHVTKHWLSLSGTKKALYATLTWLDEHLVNQECTFLRKTKALFTHFYSFTIHLSTRSTNENNSEA